MLACYYSLTSLTTVAMASAEVVLTENDIPEHAYLSPLRVIQYHNCDVGSSVEGL